MTAMQLSADGGGRESERRDWIMNFRDDHVVAVQALELAQVGVHRAPQRPRVDWRAVGLEDNLHDASELH